MRGKIVNLCIGFMNLLFGILLIIYTVKVPQDKTLMTVQENFVVQKIIIFVYFLLGMIVLTDAIQYYNHRRDTVFNTGYLIGIFSLSFIFIKEPIISSFSIICGLIVIIKSIKENLVEIDNTIALSISALIIVTTVIVSGISLKYDFIGEHIKNKENKNELAYSNDYFKYITELGIQDVYINVKKDGKYGYINQNGEVVIDFLYDYASPFVGITAYNKHFDIALVCQNGSTYIILKNGRKVLSYRTESSDQNYLSKIEELKNVYENILGQKDKMQFEVQKITDNINKVPVYQEISSDYTYRYDYNDEYDLIVTQSNLGLGDKYELAKKDDLGIKIQLNAKNLCYDSSFLYLFSNGTIPFYDISKKVQGWFTSYGKKNEMTGKAQILEFIDDKILLKNYNNHTIYFIDNSGRMLSEAFKDIYIYSDRYIVKNQDSKYKVIDKDFNKVFEEEYDIINPCLITCNLYLSMDVDSGIEFNDYGFAIMKWKLLNYNGEVILDDIEQIYDEYYQISNDKSIPFANRYSEFIEKLKDIKYDFVGDSFYLIYK